MQFMLSRLKDAGLETSHLLAKKRPADDETVQHGGHGQEWRGGTAIAAVPPGCRLPLLLDQLQVVRESLSIG